MRKPSLTSQAAGSGSPLTPDALNTYRRILPNEYFDQLIEKENLRCNNSVYTPGVVMWLMITQRLQPNGTLQTGVMELVRGLPEDFWPKPCRRLRVGADGEKPKLSCNTGSYNKARQRLPLTIVEQSCDRVYEELIQETQTVLVCAGRQAFLLDGTTIRLQHTPPLKAKYPPASNQHGMSHWPLMRMVVAHDLDTGLAMRPQWGSQAVSEQQLLEQCIDRLAGDATVVGDTNFGVFSVAYAATQR